MEEIRGTEVLEREILEEAAKGAERALKKAEGEAARIAADAAGALRAEIDARAAEALAGRERHAAEVRSRMPLSKTRLRVSFMDAAIRKELREWIDGLDGPRLAGWIASRIRAGSADLGEGALRIRYRGLPAGLVAEMAGAAAADLSAGAAKGSAPATASPAVADLSAGAAKGSAPRIEIVEDPSLGDRGVVLERADGGARLGATLARLEESLLEERRGELAAALFPGLAADPGTPDSPSRDLPNRDLPNRDPRSRDLRSPGRNPSGEA